MAVRHIRDYFEQVANQKLQLENEIRDFEIEAQKGLCDPEKIESLKELAKPVTDNYMTLSYVMYLLNMPNRDSKRRKYEIQNQPLLKSIPYRNTQSGKLEENKLSLKEIKNLYE